MVVKFSSEPPSAATEGGSLFHTALLWSAAACLALAGPLHITSITLPALLGTPLVILTPATTEAGSPFHTALL